MVYKFISVILIAKIPKFSIFLVLSSLTTPVKLFTLSASFIILKFSANYDDNWYLAILNNKKFNDMITSKMTYKYLLKYDVTLKDVGYKFDPVTLSASFIILKFSMFPLNSLNKAFSALLNVKVFLFPSKANKSLSGSNLYPTPYTNYGFASHGFGYLKNTTTYIRDKKKEHLCI